MKLEKWALIAEIVGAVAIVVTLVFVGLELNRNTNSIRASTYQSMINLSNDRITTVVESRELTALLLRDPSELDEVDLRRLDLWERSTFRMYENAFVQFTSGVIGENEWIGYRYLMCGDTLSDAWNERHRYSLSPPFVDFIESCNEN